MQRVDCVSKGGNKNKTTKRDGIVDPPKNRGYSATSRVFIVTAEADEEGVLTSYELVLAILFRWHA